MKYDIDKTEKNINRGITIITVIYIASILLSFALAIGLLVVAWHFLANW